MGLAPHTTHVPGYAKAYVSNVFIFIYLFIFCYDPPEPKNKKIHTLATMTYLTL